MHLNPRYHAQMRRFALILMLGSCLAHAEPNRPADDIERFLTDRGVLDQVGQIRQQLSQKASDLVVNAMGFLGVPYRRGGNTAENGFDCSGFVRAMFEQTVGLILPRRAREQAESTQPIDPKDLQPGDLVFFKIGKSYVSHVGVYLMNGYFVHASTQAGVIISNLDEAYYTKYFYSGGRLK